MMYTAFTPDTAHTEYRFHSINALVRRLGGNDYLVETGTAHGPRRTIMVLKHDSRYGGYHVLKTLRVPAGALTAE